MKLRYLLILHLSIVTFIHSAQVTIMGYAPQFQNQRFHVWKYKDFLSGSLQEIQDLTLEITQHTAEIQQLQDVLQGYSSLLHDVTADRDRFREDWQAMVRELSRWRPQIKGDL